MAKTSFVDFEDDYDVNKELPPSSSATDFPLGYLPKPSYTTTYTEQSWTMSVGKENRIANSFKIKTIKKLPFTPKGQFFEQLQMWGQ